MPTLKPLSHLLSGNAALAQHWSSFGARMAGIEAALAQLPASTRFEVRGRTSDRFLGAVTIADLRRKFAGISWELTGDQFGNGGVGEIRSNWKNKKKPTVWLSADQRTNAAHFLTYAAHPGESGLIYLALHETAHVTELGLTVGNHCWTMHRNQGGDRHDYPNTLHWKYNEAIANSIVRCVCARLELNELQNPNEGYVE